MLVEQNLEKWSPVTTEDKSYVISQLERLLLDTRFSHSKRYPRFLRFVVGQALEQNTHFLKERHVGIAVFDRLPDYDTNNDPIVRVTAVEIRKRLALYYDDPAHTGELRLDLPSGSYLPAFYKQIGDGKLAEPTDGTNSPEVDFPLKESSVASEERAAKPAIPLSHYLRMMTALATIAIVCSAAVWLHERKSPLNAFWAPVLQSHLPILICVDGQRWPDTSMINLPNPVLASGRPPAITVNDALTLMTAGQIMQSHHQMYRVKQEGLTTLDDLRQGPDILVGAFDNNWTLRLTHNLRFHFEENEPMTQLWIEDHDNPNNRRWAQTILANGSLSKSNTDYAIVARYTDPLTGTPVLVAAGLTSDGTAAAGEFLASLEGMRQLSQVAPHGWESKNIEIVLKTSVIGGSFGPPQILATVVW